MSGGDFAIFILCAAIVIGCILLFDTIGKVWREIIEDEARLAEKRPADGSGRGDRSDELRQRAAPKRNRARHGGDV